MKSLSGALNDFHFWRSIRIALFLVVLPFSSYSDAQVWETFPTGGDGWEVLTSGSSSTYRFNGLERLSFDSSKGQWYDKSNGDGWEPRGTTALLDPFIGDGASHMMDARWSYTLVNGGVGHWRDTVALREYKYDYSSGEWDWLNPESLAWEDYNKNTTQKSSYVDLTAQGSVREIPAWGYKTLDHITVGFADIKDNYINPDHQKYIQDIINSSPAAKQNIFLSIGGEFGTREAIDGVGVDQVVKNLVDQVTKYNGELKTGRIAGVDLDLENGVTENTINSLAKGFHEAGWKVSIAPQVFTKGWPAPQEIDPANPTNLVLTSGGHENQYGLAIRNGYVDVINVQAYNNKDFTCNNYAENQVPFIKNIARALNNWANNILPVPEGTEIFVGSPANMSGGGYSIFTPGASVPPKYAYDDQGILNQLQTDILAMQDDPVNYGRISGIFDWSMNVDFGARKFPEWNDPSAIEGGFDKTIFGATP